MNVEVELVQPGWAVFTSDGQELGTVIHVESGTIHVKTRGLMSKELSIPRSGVQDVETGRVELSMTKKEAQASRA